jgi:hypothetical protein
VTHYFSGRSVLVAAIVAIVLTAGLPPLAARTLARSRVERAAASSAQIVEAMRLNRGRLGALDGLQIVCGPGRLPYAAGPGVVWLQRPMLQSPQFASGWPADPWGRCYLFDVRRYIERGESLVLSAGTNGEVETPIDASAPAGDDIVALVR